MAVVPGFARGEEERRDAAGGRRAERAGAKRPRRDPHGSDAASEGAASLGRGRPAPLGHHEIRRIALPLDARAFSIAARHPPM